MKRKEMINKESQNYISEKMSGIITVQKRERF